MKRIILFFAVVLPLMIPAAGAAEPAKKRIVVVSSYHREYRWSAETNEGLCAALLKFGYFDSREQAAEYTKNDAVETSKMVLKKLWLDAKRKGGKNELAAATVAITKQINGFKPDLILLGDDDAVEYVGSRFLDTAIPVVFWGVNNTPVKYGLVDSEAKPGHNVTGVYQLGYKIESLRLLKAVVPGIKTFAILSDDTSAGRNHVKALDYLDRQGELPMKLIASVSTDYFEQFKNKALELQGKVDAFYVAQYSGLKDKAGHYVTTTEVARWYLTHIRIPETTQGQFVKDGMLCAAYDAGYNQGFEAAAIAHDILSKGANPATYPPRVPGRGPLMVNRQRARMLGLTLTPAMGIEEYFEKAEALETAAPIAGKKRIVVVSSYHKGYLWSQETSEGLCAALRKFGYLDNQGQIDEFNQKDNVETAKAVIKRLWLDAKRKSANAEKDENSLRIYTIAKAFRPDLIFLGDDDAAEYIGRKFLDTEIPIVFWGVNSTPLKYGLVETMENPGHNVTGVYQTGYYLESLELLNKIAPQVKTIAVLSDNTPTGRAHYKEIEYLAKKGILPFRLVESVSTDQYEQWKEKALELQKKVDAFFVAQFSDLKGKNGKYVSNEEVVRWYLDHITIPETTRGHFVKLGLLCSTYDSGYNQGYEAVVIANDILANKANPATYPPRVPKRGPNMVNVKRARLLGLKLTKDMGIEEYIDSAPPPNERIDGKK